MGSFQRAFTGRCPNTSRFDEELRRGRRLLIERLENRWLLSFGDLLYTMEDPGPTPQISSEFGSAVATDGNLTVVGAPSAHVRGEEYVGRAYVFDSASGALVATLDSPERAPNEFGYSVAISGNTVVVGTYGDLAYLFDAATGNLLHALENPTPAIFDKFGISVAISGNTVVVGAPLDDTGAQDAGSAYVFDAVTGSLLRTLNNPTPAVGDEFGYSVAVSGAAIVVGARLDDTGATDAGSAYVFNAATGGLLATIDNPTPADSDEFGYSVAISAGSVVVGAYRDDTGGTNAGSAYVFDAATGNLLRTLNNPTPAGFDYFGYSVAISGATIVVGAYGDDTGEVVAGSVYVFDAATGNLLHTLNNPTPAAVDEFGSAVAISEGAVVVGAHQDDTGAEDAGSAYIFDAATGSLAATLNSPTPASYNYFGSSAAISGSTMVVGAPQDDAGASDAGSAYIFDGVTGSLLRTLNNPTPADEDYFGSSVAISGSTVAVGAHGDGTGAIRAGSVYLFDAATGNLLHTLNNPTPAVSDEFGYSVAISGNLVVVGAHGDDTGGSNSGSAYVFDAATGNLLRTLNNPTPAGFDYFGYSVAISGATIVVGAYGDAAGATGAGSVYVFDAATGNLLRTLNNPSPVTYEQFGYSVAISENTVVVGTGMRNDSAYVFNAATGALLNTLDNPSPSAGDRFGNSVAISGSMIVVGASGDDAGASAAGSAYIFDAATGNLLRALANPTPAASEEFGRSVAASAGLVVVGALGEDGGALDRGAAYVYDADRRPMISDIADLAIHKNTSTGPIAFTVGDAETPAGLLTVSGASSDPALVPDGNIVFAGSGANRIVIVTPVASQVGTATITVTVSDGRTTASDTFLLTVNVGPLLEPIGDKTTDEEATLRFTLTASDPDDPSANVTLTASGLPDGAGLTKTSAATWLFQWTPTNTQAGFYHVTFTADAGAQSLPDSETITIGVGEVWRLPVNKKTSYGAILRRNGDNIELVNKARPKQRLFTVPDGSVPRVTVRGRDKFADALIVDYSKGSLTLSEGVAFDGGAGKARDVFTIKGTTGPDVLAVAAEDIAINGVTHRLVGVEAVTLNGGAGDDTYLVSALSTKTTLIDSKGIDSLDFSGAAAGVKIVLSKIKGEAQKIFATSTKRLGLKGVFENVIGTPYGDFIRGNAAANRILGGGGNDTLYGGGGNDTLYGGPGDDWLYGDAGNDTLFGESGNNVLLGAAGNDTLNVLFNADPSGRNLLIGGYGLDTLQGGPGEEILIGGTTKYDSNAAALAAVMREWTSAQSFADRCQHLETGILLGKDKVRLKRSATVLDDQAADSLYGGPGSDWFFDFTKDDASNRTIEEDR